MTATVTAVTANATTLLCYYRTVRIIIILSFIPFAKRGRGAKTKGGGGDIDHIITKCRENLPPCACTRSRHGRGPGRVRNIDEREMWKTVAAADTNSTI